MVGHNLDQEFHTPGALLINPRGEVRQSRCGDDIGLTESSSPRLTWVSRFGSVTFSILGNGLPDGGINEAGLTLSEMALGQSRFPRDPRKPTMFIHQWIQYQLDSYATVEEMLEHLNDVNIDPRATFSPVSMANYHFFVADARGDAAVIEFLDGEAVVHTGDDLKVPVLCNMPYAYEMHRLEKVSGFAGWFFRWLDSDQDQRFLVGSDGLMEFEPGRQADAIGYAFDLLAHLQFESTRQWGIVYDISNRSIAFRTVRSPGIKTLQLEECDFSAGGNTQMFEDLDAAEAGEIVRHLEPYSVAANRSSIRRFLHSLMAFVVRSRSETDFDRYLEEHYDLTFEEYVQKAVRISTGISR